MKNYSYNSVFSVLQIIALLLVCSATFGQASDYKNLKAYTEKEHLYDFGYGLDHYPERLDSIICFNDFIDPTINFTELNKLSFVNNDTVYEIELSRKEYFIKGLCIYDKSRNRVSDMKFGDESDFTYVAHIYDFIFRNKGYLLLYTANDYKKQNMRGSVQGCLIDKATKAIIKLPEELNTDSLLPITDIDNDGTMDFVAYAASTNVKTLEVYSLKNSAWVRRPEYSIKLS
jgi:hypothetical protein